MSQRDMASPIVITSYLQAVWHNYVPKQTFSSCVSSHTGRYVRSSYTEYRNSSFNDYSEYWMFALRLSTWSDTKAKCLSGSYLDITSTNTKTPGLVNLLIENANRADRTRFIFTSNTNHFTTSHCCSGLHVAHC